MSSFLVCLIHGVGKGENPDKIAAVEDELKQLIRAASGFSTENTMVFFEQNLRFQDTKEDIYCEVKWPQGEIPQFDPKTLREAISGLFNEIFSVKKVRVDFKT